MTDTILRRSQLVTPASSEKIIAKAMAADCDSLVIDLEDAIAPSQKAAARDLLRRVLSTATDPLRGRRELGVRINGLESPWCLDDLQALQGLPIDTVVVPKIHAAEDLYVFDCMLGQLERRSGGMPRLTLQPLIESARGLEHAASIARASSRCVSLIYGVGDYMADTGVPLDSPLVSMARARVVNAAAAAGVMAIDHVHPAVADVDGLRNSSLAGRALGFAGRWAIHPGQIATINACFSPGAAELDKARRTVAAYEAALAAGEGAITLDGELVDEAVLKIARRHLATTHRDSPTSGVAS